MKLLIVLCLVSLALARPRADRDAEIVDMQNDLREDQSYDFNFETSNNILREESGVSYPGEKSETGNFIISGSYEFVHPDGTITSINYIADENGYRPQGDVIPVFNYKVDIQDA